MYAIAANETLRPIIAVLSLAVIAVGGFNTDRVDIMNWETGAVLHTLSGCGEMVRGLALLGSSMQLVVVSGKGTLTIWDMDNWAAPEATVIRHGSGFAGVVGSSSPTGEYQFATLNTNGLVERWCGQNPEILTTDASILPSYNYYGCPLAIVGNSLVVAGFRSTFIVVS